VTADPVEATVAGHRVEAELAGGGEDGVLLVHGLAGDRRSWGPVPERLAREGFTALAVDLRGHGESQGPRGLLSRERVLEDLAAWADVLEAQGARVDAVVGHSLGGLWALAAQPALGANAVAAVATPASIAGQVGLLEGLGYRAGGVADRALRALGGSRRTVPYRVTLDDTLDHPRVKERWRGEGLLDDELPLANADALMSLDGRDLARRVDAPALVAHPVRDELVPREAVHPLYRALAEPRTWLELPGPHALFLDVERDEAARRLAAWLDGALR